MPIARSLSSLPIITGFIAAVILIAVVGALVIELNSGGDQKFPRAVYFGEPAMASDLFIPNDNASPTNLMGKWEILSINEVPVAPAEDWMEKPAIAHLNFEQRENEIVLTGYSGCNVFGGKSYTIERQLHTPELMMTARGCGGNPLLHPENTLLRILSSRGVWTNLSTQNDNRIIVGSEKIGFIRLKKLNK